MFLYPALAVGFAFVAVPLLVHLINLLRHRRQRWAAMDFLIASYRKQRNWIFLKQLLLLLSRISIAALLVALLAGWVSGSRLLDLVGTRTTHHLYVLDDSYSMGDTSGGATAYSRALDSLRVLADRLAKSEGNHQITVVRSSRAALVTRAGSDNADAAADLSARSLLGDAGVIQRVMATSPSAVQTDLVAALQLGGKLLSGTAADQRIAYIASDFRSADWQSPQRAAEAIGELSRGGAAIKMIDCGVPATGNLAITSLTPVPDVWVAGVPVVVRATVKNYGTQAVKNVTLAARVIRYGSDVVAADPTRRVSGQAEALPAMLIDEIPAGGEETKSFQVYITQPGTHALEVSIPDDALAIDNRRACTLPLSDLERVLIIDGEIGGRGAFHVAAVLDPGGQVRTGAVPDVQSPAFLRSITAEQLARYRAVYVVDPTEINDNIAELLKGYVEAGGGLCWFLGPGVDRDAFNRVLSGPRRLLPGRLEEATDLPQRSAEVSPDMILGRPHPLTEPLAGIGNAAFSLLGVSRSWGLAIDRTAQGDAAGGEGSQPGSAPSSTARSTPATTSGSGTADAAVAEAAPVREVLLRRDGRPLVVQHEVGRGRVITSLVGLDGRWTNWSGDPTFVVFLLQANAYLWSAASPQISVPVEDGIRREHPEGVYTDELIYLAPVNDPPRVPLPWAAVGEGRDRFVAIDPKDQVIAGGADVEGLMQVGIGEVVVTELDGQSRVIPTALTLAGGGSDLGRSEAEEIRRAVQPVDVRFVTAGELAQQYGGPSGSATMLVLLGLLLLFLAIEQVLGYLGSYHAPAEAAIPVPVQGGLATSHVGVAGRRHQR
ncbi:MAG: hypothetical protein EA381_12260 [Planctomycetaceae bacterium]|nr:MAG: hypothetical protein EA381_12260 [Planctomycetaceae bacterium]